MAFVATAAVAAAGAAVVGTAATVYGVYNSYKASQNQKKAAQIQVAGQEVAVRAAELRVKSAETAVLGPEINIAAAEQKRIAALFSGEAAARGYEFDAAIDRRNAAIKKQDADYVRAVGEIQQTKVGLEGRFKLGQAKTAQAASNLDVNRGSAVQVRQSMKDLNRFEQATVAANAGKAAFGLDAQGANLLAQAALSEMSAHNARVTGELGAKGAEYEKAGAELAKKGALYAVEGAKLGVEGAKKGVSAAEFGVGAAGYAGAGAIATGVGSVASKWMQAKDAFGGSGEGSVDPLGEMEYDAFMNEGSSGSGDYW